MKISVNEQGCIEFEEVFNSVCFKTENGQVLAVCMRDGGFEIGLSNPINEPKSLNWYRAESGQIIQLLGVDYGSETGNTRTLRANQGHLFIEQEGDKK